MKYSTTEDKYVTIGVDVVNENETLPMGAICCAKHKNSAVVCGYRGRKRTCNQYSAVEENWIGMENQPPGLEGPTRPMHCHLVSVVDELILLYDPLTSWQTELLTYKKDKVFRL